MKPAIARALHDTRDARILDCGCGTGSNLEMLRPYGRAVGFDLTAIGVRFARGHGHSVAQASIDAIPFTSATFDLVTSFDVFQTDQALCKQFASDQIRGGAEQSNNRQVGTAVVGTLLGAGLGAALGGGRGAAVGAGVGAVGGTAVGAGGGQQTQYSLQQRYDMAYAQCMYSRGNQVPGYQQQPQQGYAPPPPGYQPAPPGYQPPPLGYPPPGYYR